MLLDRGYYDVRAEIDEQDGHGHDGDWSTNGVTDLTLLRLLGAAGFFHQRRYASWCPEWPPVPFAPVHFATVRQPSGRSHYVVMSADGGVLDPCRAGTFSLSDWHNTDRISPGVLNVVGLVRP